MIPALPMPNSTMQMPKAEHLAQTKAAAKEFEAAFISQMFSHMFTDLDTNNPFGGGHAESVWRGPLMEEYGKIVADAGGIGMADHIYKTLLAIQEG